MLDLLINAGVFVAIIALGYVLKRVGLFKDSDFHVLSKIVLRITLPAAIVVSFSSSTMDVSMLSITFIGLCVQALFMVIGYVTNLRSSKEEKAFCVLNIQGCNIGNFTMPFVQSFMGPVGIIATSLFDTGNAVFALGGAYSIASMIKTGGKIDFKRIFVTLIRSVPLLVYVIMTVLTLVQIRLPSPVISFARVIGNSNAFLAMFTIGVGFQMKWEMSQFGKIAKILVPRYLTAVLLSLVVYFILPFDYEIRKTLVILVFAPISGSVPPYTAELGEDVGLSSAINSMSIVISIVIIVALLSVIH